MKIFLLIVMVLSLSFIGVAESNKGQKTESEAPIETLKMTCEEFDMDRSYSHVFYSSSHDPQRDFATKGITYYRDISIDLETKEEALCANDSKSYDNGDEEAFDVQIDVYEVYSFCKTKCVDKANKVYPVTYNIKWIRKLPTRPYNTYKNMEFRKDCIETCDLAYDYFK